jgi:hypothetical protein
VKSYQVCELQAERGFRLLGDIQGRPQRLVVALQQPVPFLSLLQLAAQLLKR